MSYELEGSIEEILETLVAQQTVVMARLEVLARVAEKLTAETGVSLSPTQTFPDFFAPRRGASQTTCCASAPTILPLWRIASRRF